MRGLMPGDRVVMKWPKKLRGKIATVIHSRYAWARNQGSYLCVRLTIDGEARRPSGTYYEYDAKHMRLVNANGIGSFGDWMRKVAEK